MPDDEVTKIRMVGSEATCRALLDVLSRVAHLSKIDGPYPRRSGGGVTFYAEAVPVRFAPEPGA